jgi:hypothetical protein
VKRYRRIQGLILLAVLGGMASLASAARVDLVVFENDSNANVSGLDLWVDVLNSAGKADFVFHNDSSISSIITQIYFESGLSSLIANGTIAVESSGVDFKVGATPANPPGGTNIGWTGTFYSDGRVNQGGVSNGINNVSTETLTVRFDLIGGKSVDDVIAALGKPGSRIAEHIQSLPQGASVTAVTTTIVPLPEAFGPGLILLGSIAAYRLRRVRPTR